MHLTKNYCSQLSLHARGSHVMRTWTNKEWSESGNFPEISRTVLFPDSHTISFPSFFFFFLHRNQSDNEVKQPSFNYKVKDLTLKIAEER